jgi:hypothetical protein
MLKDLFDKGKCALGFHLGDWRYLQDESCQQSRLCSRCKTASQQLVHTWRTWDYETADSCRMARRCGRCAEIETKLEHTWATAVYASEESCVLVRPCCAAAKREQKDAPSMIGATGIPVNSTILRCVYAGGAGKWFFNWIMKTKQIKSLCKRLTGPFGT